MAPETKTVALLCSGAVLLMGAVLYSNPGHQNPLRGPNGLFHVEWTELMQPCRSVESVPGREVFDCCGRRTTTGPRGYLPYCSGSGLSRRVRQVYGTEGEFVEVIVWGETGYAHRRIVGGGREEAAKQPRSPTFVPATSDGADVIRELGGCWMTRDEQDRIYAVRCDDAAAWDRWLEHHTAD